MHHQGGAVFEQGGIEAGGYVSDSLRACGQVDATEAEVFSVVGIDLQGEFEFSESVAAGTEHDGQLVGSGSGVKLVFVAIGILGELLPLVLIQIEIDGVTE